MQINLVEYSDCLSASKILQARKMMAHNRFGTVVLWHTLDIYTSPIAPDYITIVRHEPGAYNSFCADLLSLVYSGGTVLLSDKEVPVSLLDRLMHKPKATTAYWHEGKVFAIQLGTSTVSFIRSLSYLQSYPDLSPEALSRIFYAEVDING